MEEFLSQHYLETTAIGSIIAGILAKFGYRQYKKPSPKAIIRHLKIVTNHLIEHTEYDDDQVKRMTQPILDILAKQELYQKAENK